MESEINYSAVNTKKTLLEKYDIPINHLDFDYIKKCENSKEVERMLLILRSGEEGYYPDLTKCAEERLRELKPNSKCFRTEEPILTKEGLDDETRISLFGDIQVSEDCFIFLLFCDYFDSISQQFEENMKNVRSKLDCDTNKRPLHYPPVRQTQEMSLNKRTTVAPPSKDRIKSLEYDKWDKYDAGWFEILFSLINSLTLISNTHRFTGP